MVAGLEMLLLSSLLISLLCMFMFAGSGSSSF